MTATDIVPQVYARAAVAASQKSGAGACVVLVIVSLTGSGGMLSCGGKRDTIIVELDQSSRDRSS